MRDMCSISRLGYVSGTVCIDENGVYIVWFGTHITINSIGMKMGEPPDPTIYSWMSHWKYSMTMPTCECKY